MKNKSLVILLVFAVIFTSLGPALATAELAESPELLSVSASGYVDALVFIEDDFQLEEYSIASEDIRDEDKDRSRLELVEGLKERAETSQKPIYDFLEHKMAIGEALEYESFYIVNAIHVIAQYSVLEEMAQLPGVIRIQNNGEIETQSSAVDLASNTAENLGWNLNQIQAQNVWNEMGVIGQGVTIGFIDSGVNWQHPAIKSNWRGYDRATGAVDPNGNWLDLVHNSDLPTDGYFHGTAIVSVAVGGTDSEGMHIGVAPGAKWIGVRAFEDRNTTNVNIIKAAQWMLAPGGDPTKAPDIINNSWGGEASTNPWFVDILGAWKAAGIFPIFASGNAATTVAAPGTIENPANLLNAFSVGAVNKQLGLANFSKRGPSLFDPTGSVIKPEVVGPGSSIRVAVRDDSYANMFGTSIAAPHISGIAALLKSKYPELSVSALEQLIIDSAVPMTDGNFPNSPNMGYGHGMPNAYTAMEQAGFMDRFHRISGPNRYATAVAISREYFPQGASTVFLTSGISHSDALVMTPLSSLREGPLLLTEDNRLNPETFAEIQRLNPEKIIIVGGERYLPETFREQLSAAGYTVERIHGENRFATSLEIAKAVDEEVDFTEIFLVNGFKDADAISIAGTAGALKQPILLMDGMQLSGELIQWMAEAGIKKVTAIGGNATIPDSVQTQLEEMGLEFGRFGGANRFGTSLSINRFFYPQAAEVFVANGNGIVDALSAGPIAALYGRPMLLVQRDIVPEGVIHYLSETKHDRVLVFGGENSVSVQVLYGLLKKR
ncbi:MAG: S8 family serine peptidase [Tissierellia bacterium]|nr:S8 family serine peptidase [Tissierellia bacterium]